jgi:hypothetical protein
MRNIYRILVSFIQVFLNNWTIVAEELSTKGAEGILEITENVGDNCARGKAKLAERTAERVQQLKLIP